MKTNERYERLRKENLMLTQSLCIAMASYSFASETIVDKAIEVESLSTLVAAVQAADLVEALKSDGNMTVFAPTNEAFAMIDASALSSLLEPSQKNELTRILLHHVIPFKLDSRELAGMSSVTTLAGTELSISFLNGRVLVDEAVVNSADIEVSNGIVHVIDRVLLPPQQVDPIQQLLLSAIDKGVPLFNDGMGGSCADVYETALEAVFLFADAKINKNYEMDFTNARQGGLSDNERAWAYRRIMDRMLTNDILMTEKASLQSDDNAVSLFSFDNPRETGNWYTVLDGVMGGLSTGNIRVANGSLTFSGKTSLRNNGGFSSMRANVDSSKVSQGDAIELKVKGDGRTYIVGTKNSSGMGGESFWTRFDTKKNEWMTVVVPIAEMEKHYFGNRVSGRITPSQVKAIEFYIYDKKAGPFELEIDSINVVNIGRNSRLALLNN